MATIVLFHSVLGLRDAEKRLAAEWSDHGHRVATPDLYDGAATDLMAEGFAIRKRVGWDAIMVRARHAVAALPADTVLAGVSMGAGVVGDLWPARTDAQGVLLIHGLCDVPANARAGLPAQVHLADPDAYESAETIDAWRTAAAGAGLKAEIFLYPGPGHYFLDATLRDYDRNAAVLAEARIVDFLQSL